MNIDIIKEICYDLYVNGDGTHNKKRLYAKYTGGMIPIEKNITVVDEQGNEYEATYPKRAKGLVKNGRAHFIGENKICLMRPPNSKSEDNRMSDNINTKKFTIDYILEQIAKVQEQLLNITDIINSIGCVGDSSRSGDENISVSTEVAVKKVEAMSDVFYRREDSLKKLLEIYDKMYDDLIGREALEK